MASAHKWIHTSFDVAFAIFWLGVLAFTAMSIVIIIVQGIRKQEWWEAPGLLMMPAMLLWLVFSIAGVVAAVLNVLKAFV
jgi:hypothetical protein